MTGWGDKHHPPISRLTSKRRAGSIFSIRPDDQGEQYEIARFYSKLVEGLLGNETTLILILAFLLSVIPSMFL